jgi:5-methylcytosine-specific restriction endonuclease McrA
MSPRNGSSRPELDGALWKRTRATVRRWDGNRCVVCGSTARLEVHHAVPARRKQR